MIDSPPERPPRWAGARANAPWILAALAPGALTVYFAFHAGGYFAGPPAAAAIVLLIALAARLTTAKRPQGAFGPGLILAAVALGLFALWTLLSGRWSHASSRALFESDRALLYLLALVLFGSLGRGPARLRWMLRGVALAAVVVCVSSLITRVLPGVWPLDYGSITTRLSYPVTYWNGLGLLAALGIILCFGITSDLRESRVARILAAAAIPALASTLLLTLSRGGILAAVLGLVVFAVVGHPRALACGLLASGPATVIALVCTYRADLLVSENPLTQAARDQGRNVAILVGLCVLAAALIRAVLWRVDERMLQTPVSARARRWMLTAGGVALVLALAGGAVAVDLPRQYDRFLDRGGRLDAALPNDARDRLSDPSNDGRLQHYRVSLDEFERSPLHGSGAGTFELSWAQHRPEPGLVHDGHSLYLEVLGELGLVGLVLIVTAIVAILAGIARRVRGGGADRILYATLFAAALTWAGAAGIDWHWEMPVVTLWFFALGGAALARTGDRDEPDRGPGPRMPARIAMAAACCALALAMPVRVAISQDRVSTALDAFVTGRCGDATSAAHDSLRAVGGRPQPYEILAYCALVDGDEGLAVSRMASAVRRDPSNWALRYGLARTRALAGRDPRGAAGEALRLNPLEPTTIDAAKRFKGLTRPSQWKRAAQGMEILFPDL
jgi:O-antigen ligase